MATREWESAVDEATGHTYYFRSGSVEGKSSTWERPVDFREQTPANTGSGSVEDAQLPSQAAALGVTAEAIVEAGLLLFGKTRQLRFKRSVYSQTSAASQRSRRRWRSALVTQVQAG